MTKAFILLAVAFLLIVIWAKWRRRAGVIELPDGGVQFGGSAVEEDIAGELADDSSRRADFLAALADQGIVVMTTIPDGSGSFEWLDYEDEGKDVFPLFTSAARAETFARGRLGSGSEEANHAALSMLTLEPEFLWSNDLTGYEVRVNPGSDASTVLLARDVERLRALVDGRSAGD